MSDEANNRDDSDVKTSFEGSSPLTAVNNPELAHAEGQLFNFLIQEFLGFFNIEPFLEKVRQEGAAFIRDNVGDWAKSASKADELRSSLEAIIPELIARAYEASFFSHITVLDNTLGLGKFSFDRIALASYLAFTEEYDIGRHHDKEMMTAIELCARWGNSAKEFEKNATNLPIYLFNRKMETWTSITHRIPSLKKIAEFQKSPDGWKLGLSDVPNVWFCVAHWWRFKRAHIEFYEKLKPKIGIVLYDLTLEWFTYDELLDRWNISVSRLEEAITGRDLKVYMLNPVEGIMHTGVQLPIFIDLDIEVHQQYLFSLDNVHQFERNNLEFLKMAENVCDRKQAQDLARKWLRQTPNLRSGDVIGRLRQKEQFSHISRNETLRSYIRSLITNKTPGPPKKSEPPF